MAEEREMTPEERFEDWWEESNFPHDSFEVKNLCRTAFLEGGRQEESIQLTAQANK